ncbi:TIM barrel protein [Leptolyngbya sp. AN03gr2]|uniref:TIM barrel protein n=1 Tax=unclassified Leptolyngbya TaxID=2650499 RepID=UPI003D310767
MSNLWISLSTYGGVTTRTALDVLWAAGTRQVELAVPWLSRSEFGVKPTLDTTAVLQHYRQRGMQYRAHHAIGWQEHRSVNLAQRFDAGYFERLTDWLAVMQIEAYSVHAGRVLAQHDAISDWERFLRHLQQLQALCYEHVPVCQRHRSIRPGVETMYPDPSDSAGQYLLQTAQEVEALLAVLPNVELVVDLAHLNLWHRETLAEKLQVLNLAPNRVLEIHISDNDGYQDNHTMVTPTTWWVPHIEQFPPHVPIVLESRMNGQTSEQIRQQIQRIQTLVTPQFHSDESWRNRGRQVGEKAKQIAN